MKYDFYQDPGHGWLKVQIQELVQLGIQDKISGCSYMRNESAYLEEDGDLSCFFAAKKFTDFNKVCRVHTANNSSKIRSYNSFDYAQYLALKSAIKKYDEDPILRKWVNQRLDNKSGASYFKTKTKYDQISSAGKTWFYNIAKNIQKEALEALDDMLNYLRAFNSPSLNEQIQELVKEREIIQ